MIEVEKRALIDEDTYHTIGQVLLAKGAVDEGTNDTVSTFYVQEGSWQLKVQHQISKGAAKIAWKSGGIDGAESRHEVELTLAPTDVANANEIITAIAPMAKVYPTKQQRHDYTLGNIGIAVKYSADWGYHLELDCVVADEKAVDAALRRITQLAAELGIHLLEPNEEKAFVQKAIRSRKEQLG